MSVKYKIDPDTNLIYYLATGLCPARDILQAEREAARDPLRQPGMKIIVDIQLAELDVDVSDVKDLISLNKELNEKGFELEKTALITRNTFFYTLAEGFFILTEGLPIKLKIFHTLQDATTWLGLSNEKSRVIQTHDLLADAPFSK